jgi:hypothetical protein
MIYDLGFGTYTSVLVIFALLFPPGTEMQSPGEGQTADSKSQVLNHKS